MSAHRRRVIVYDHMPLPPLPEPPSTWRLALAGMLMGIAHRLTRW